MDGNVFLVLDRAESKKTTEILKRKGKTTVKMIDNFF